MYKLPKLGDVEFSGEDGKGSLAAGSVVTPDSKKNPAVIYGDKETAMMKGAKTAMVSNALVWRAENNDLMKRMGDLRLSEGESGIWAKYYGGKYSMDAGKQAWLFPMTMATLPTALVMLISRIQA